MNETPDDTTPTHRNGWVQELRFVVRFLYDCQRLRIASEGRKLQQEAGKEVELNPGDIGYMDGLAVELETLEEEATAHIESLLRQDSIGLWLLNEVKGCGPRMAGVLRSEVQMKGLCPECEGEGCDRCDHREPGLPIGVVDKCPYVSSLWKFCGLAVDVEDAEEYETASGGTLRSGTADSLTRGETAPYNTFLKTKLLGVLAGSFLRANSPYRAYYDHRRNYKANQLVDPCMACKGDGEAKDENGDPVECWNCGGNGGPAPWGRSDAHRHRDGLRIMVKEFLKDYYKVARRAQGMEIREPYGEAKLDRKHTDKPTDPDTPDPVPPSADD